MRAAGVAPVRYSFAGVAAFFQIPSEKQRRPEGGPGRVKGIPCRCPQCAFSRLSVKWQTAARAYAALPSVLTPRPRARQAGDPAAAMNPIDHYPQTVAWSDEDQCYIGYCPAFFVGGACHGSDPVKVLRALRGHIAGEMKRYRAEGLKLPRPAKVTRPRQTVGQTAAA